MPIYEYRCAACGHTLEALQKFSDKPLRKCPECSKSSLKRLISAPSFRLKGGGWYETDFKQGSEKKRNLVDGGEASAAPKDAGKSDSKSDGKKSEGDAKTPSSKPKETPAKASSSASSDSASS
jgi:putative FmdB family regulatory protein